MERSRSATLSDAWNLRRVSSIAPAIVFTSGYRYRVRAGHRHAKRHDAQQYRVDTHGHPDTTVERLARGGDTGDRQRALFEGAGGKHQEEQHDRPAGLAAHDPDCSQ